MNTGHCIHDKLERAPNSGIHGNSARTPPYFSKDSPNSKILGPKGPEYDHCNMVRRDRKSSSRQATSIVTFGVFPKVT